METMVLKYLKYLREEHAGYFVVPEISDVGRLHCHGWFVISDKINGTNNYCISLPEMEDLR